MGKLKDFFEAVVGFAAGSTLVGLVLGKVELGFEAIKSFFVSSFKQNILYFGLSYITSKGSEDTAQRNLGIKRAVTNPVAPRNVIYGKTRVGGTIVQRTVSSKTGSTSQNVLHNVIAVAGHEINNITKVFMDAGKGTVELDLSSDFTSATENSTTVFRCTNSAFVNADNTDAYTSGSLVKLAFEKGDQTAANGYAVAQIPSGSWSTDHKLLGIAYVYINCIYDTEKFTAIPTFSFEVEGKKVFDPVSSSTVYSTNPALIIRDYLMDSTYGFGAVADEINDAASGAGFVQARSDCNDSVSVTGGSESRFTLNGEFVATEEPQRVLETMLSACAGQLLYNNGKFSLFVGKGRTASGTITDDKILAPIQIQTKASGKDLVNGVKATYVRPDDKYIAGEITPYKDSTFLTEDTPTGKASADYENFLDLAFPYTHSTFTAQRLARIALNYERQDQTLSVLVPLDFLSHQVGDIVNLDNDRLGYSGKDFEIIGMSFEFMGDQYLALRLSLKEYSSTIFDFFTYVADPTLPSEPPSGDNTVGSPTGLTLTEGIKDAQVRIHTIRATWTNSVDDKIVTTEVAYKKSTDSDFDAADVSYPSNSFIFNAEPATTYNVKVRHISNTGVSSAYTGTVNLTTSGGQVTLTTGTISGITIESGKLYQGTGTFNNSNTGFFIDSSGQFSLKDKLSFNGTTLNISGNLTVENTITADKIVVGGITLDNLISASDQSSSNYLTTFSGAVKIASGGASAGYPAELQIQATEHTNAIGTLQQSQTQLTIRARNNTSNGAIAFQGFNGTTPTNYGNFDASGNLNLNQNLVVSGDLTVSGTTTTVDTTNTNVKDNNLTLNYSTGDSSSTANGAGLTIQDAVSASTDATILWNASADRFDLSHGLRINADDQVFTVGAGGDFSLSHNGTDTFMANNTGHFYITTTSDDKDIIFRTDDGSGGVTSYFRVDGSTENVIYQKNLKLQDNVQAQFGTGEDLKIYHDGSHSYIQSSGSGTLVVEGGGSTGDLSLRATDDADIKVQNGELAARFIGNGAVELYHNNSKKFETTSVGATVTGFLISTTAVITDSIFPDTSNAAFSIKNSSEGTIATFNNDLSTSFLGHVLLGDNKVIKIGTNLDLQLLHDGSNSIIKNVATGNLIIRNVVDDGDIILQSDDGSGGLTNYITLDGSEAQTKFGQDAKFGDSIKAKFGSAGDLEIYHDGSASYIDDTGTGQLILNTNGSQIALKFGSENMAVFTVNDAVKLYYDSSKKFETTSTGIDVTGGISASSTVNTFGNGSVALQWGDTSALGALSFDGSANPLIRSYSSKPLVFQTNGANEVMRLDTSGNLGLGTSSPAQKLEVAGRVRATTDPTFEVYESSSKRGGIQWDASSVFTNIFSVGGDIRFDIGGEKGRFSSSGLSVTGAVAITSNYNTSLGGYQINGTTVIDSSRNLTNIGTISSGTITSSGNIDVNSDSGQLQFGADNDMQMFHNGAKGEINIATGNFDIDSAGEITLDADTSGVIRLKDGGTEFGKISQNSNNLRIFSSISDGDILLQGNDGGSTITALTLDMSAGGNARFSGDISLTGSIQNTVVPAEASVKINENGYNDGTTYFRDLDIFDGKGNQFVKFDGSTQRVGIGTNAPSQPLQINTGGTSGGMQITSTDADAFIHFNETSDNKGFFISLDGNNNSGSNHSLSFFSQDGGSNVNRMMITNAGNIGLGTSSPSEKLHVIGNILTSGGVKVGDSSADALHFFGILKQGSGSGTTVIDASRNLTNIGTYAGTGDITLNSGSNQVLLAVTNGALEITRSAGGPFIDFKNSTSDDFDSRIMGGNALIFSTGGNGSTATALTLGSNQSATFAGNIEGSLIKATDQFQSISGSRTLVMNANFSGLGAIGMSSNDHLTFVTNNTERMRLDNSGRVGIGISSVTNALGWGSMAQIGGANPALSLRNTNSNQWDIANFGGTFNIYNGANSRFQIDSSGNTTVTGTEFRLGSSSVVSRIRTINASGFTETAFDNFSSGAYQERMRISSSGSVGIAKTNPSSSYKLDVNGKIRSQQEILINTGSLFINEEGEGIHILSANGTEYKLTVSNAGALVITEV